MVEKMTKAERLIRLYIEGKISANVLRGSLGYDKLTGGTSASDRRCSNCVPKPLFIPPDPRRA